MKANERASHVTEAVAAVQTDRDDAVLWHSAWLKHRISSVSFWIAASSCSRFQIYSTYCSYTKHVAKLWTCTKNTRTSLLNEKHVWKPVLTLIPWCTASRSVHHCRHCHRFSYFLFVALVSYIFKWWLLGVLNVFELLMYSLYWLLCINLYFSVCTNAVLFLSRPKPDILLIPQNHALCC